MADRNTRTVGGFHSLGDILTTLVGGVHAPNFNGLEKVGADPFRGPHLGEVSNYEAAKAHIANSNPTPAEYEGAIHTYTVERKI